MHRARPVAAIGETVLVLEADRRRLLRHEEILAALGYEPVGFTGLQEAAQACAVRARFDAALVCHQPGASFALDFATTLRELAPNLPIVLATTRRGISTRNCWQLPAFPRSSIIR